MAQRRIEQPPFVPLKDGMDRARGYIGSLL
jgi:hypothetical protein